MGRKIFLLAACCVLLIGAVFPLKEYAAGITVTAAVDGLNIRSGPGLSYSVVATVKKGAVLTVLSEKGEWMQLRLSTGKTGWAANWLVNRQQAASKTNTTAIITADKLRIRSGPGTNYSMTGSLTMGEQVTILEKSGLWSKIESKRGSGWVSSEFLKETGSPGKTTGTAPATTAAKTKIKVVNADILNVRTTPSSKAAVAGKLKQGAKVEVLSESNGWSKISFSNGKTGWVSSEFLSAQEESPNSGKNSTGVIGTVTATALSVRNTGSLNGKIIATVKKGQKFSILEEKNSWAKIEYQKGKYGWVAGWYLDKAAETGNAAGNTGKEVNESKVTILHDGSNIRQKPELNAKVIARGNKGEQFKVKKVSGSWYEIELKNGSSGFIAGWIVQVSGSAPQISKEDGFSYLKNKVIVIDPGHGGIDTGTIGVRGTYEKGLTLKTANLLTSKLKKHGAKVVMTRSRDTYYSLPSRVSSAYINGADAFISIHYDSINDRTVRGMTTYYYHSYQKKLAETVHSATVTETKSKNRNARFGDYHVIRENKQAAALIELGFLSNASEEMGVLSNQFQESASTGIMNGLARYFKEK
ncbi:SH3 domain-containing protein [Bacillus sp. EB01]|uniref:SH3 domain-containing protein n=1 Tax=Bacillus sp. EB01 TaxID=1347086 RepID=UPI0006948C43|nr:SH3 domain-containing protein [Bacillus sp. EB01]